MAKYRITVTALPDSELPIEKAVECDGYMLVGYTKQVGDECDMDIDMHDLRDVDLKAAIRAAAPLRRNAIGCVMDTLGRTVDVLLAPDERDDTQNCFLADDEEDEEDAAE